MEEIIDARSLLEESRRRQRRRNIAVKAVQYTALSIISMFFLFLFFFMFFKSVMGKIRRCGFFPPSGTLKTTLRCLTRSLSVTF